MPSADRVAATNSIYGSYAAFIAETHGPNDHHRCSEAQGKYVQWCIDSGASNHMTNSKGDFYNLGMHP
jgi:hypothetical protein